MVELLGPSGGFIKIKTCSKTCMAWMVVVAGILWLSQGLFFGVVTLLLWIVIDLLCVGAGIKRKHYRAYLKAARQGDAHASDQMAEELALIHGLPVDCSELLYSAPRRMPCSSEPTIRFTLSSSVSVAAAAETYIIATSYER